MSWIIAILLIVIAIISYRFLDKKFDITNKLKQLEEDYKLEQLERTQKQKENKKHISKNRSTITFSYKDSEGFLTKRTVDIYSVEDPYINGFCHLRNEERTFIIDRIVGNVIYQGKSLSVQEWLDLANVRIKRKLKNTKLNVCFTGFTENQLSNLTKIANEKNFNVRKTITDSLHFLVVGNNDIADHKKIKKADDELILILTEQQFYHMLETGEIPTS
ncbi:Uncharacterised protein [Gallibacterium anatis]|uniref:BRCT domain-containing protein n=1 Tax=Gallibacterium anatis TaxID=750 RepID=A0A377H5P5_9PAST|nr:BRCT domain-containing protein [Gallibacterium anatis]STO37822.1 Uncharacterised protein [Gallibacterium anatis]